MRSKDTWRSWTTERLVSKMLLRVADTLASVTQVVAVSAVNRPPGRRVAVLVTVLTVLVAPHLEAQTSVTYPVPTFYSANPEILFDGTNIWVTGGSNSVTKLLASSGAVVGTYAAEIFPEGIVFDGTNIWVTNNSGFAASGTVTDLLASTGALLGTYIVGRESDGAEYAALGPFGITFDGTNIWVTDVGSNSVTKLLASTGAAVGNYSTGSAPWAVAFDGANICVANAGDGTVTKLLASTGALLGTYSTRAGTNAVGIAFDGTNIWVTNYGGNTGNTVTELLASTGARVNTYTVGKGPYGIAFDGANIWVANAGDNTVTKISSASRAQAPSISPAGVVPLDSTASTIQPGEWVSIYGTNLASSAVSWTGNFPTSLGGTSVKINGKAAYLSLVSPGQINLQAPDDTTTGPVPVVVSSASGSAPSTVTLGQFAPSFALLDAKHVAGIIPRSDGSGAYAGGTFRHPWPNREFSRLSHGSRERRRHR